MLYLVELSVDPELEYVVVDIDEIHAKHIDLNKMFNTDDSYPQALFGERKLAKEYAAYRNLRLHQ